MTTVKVFRSVSLAGLALSFGFTLHADDVSFSSPERLQVPDMKELEGAEVVDYAALRRKLTRREIKGAVLDVFDPEPLPRTSPLWSTPNLIMTPHVASDDSVEYIPRTLDLVLENAARHLDGRALKNRVIPSREY